MKTKIAAVRQERGEQITIMEANVACSNQQETNAYSAARDEAERLGSRITDLEAMTQVAEVLRVGAEFAARNCDKPLGEFRKLALDERARQSGGPEIMAHHGATTLRDGHDGLVSHMAEALSCRYSGEKPSEGAREFMNASIAEMARVICSANGLRAPGFGADKCIQLAMTSTSDFPHLTQEVGNRVLLAAYESATPAIQTVARRSSARDFKTKSALRISGGPKLIKVLESGEVTHGGRAESKESYRVYTFARIFGITREALINDDLGAFTDFARSYGIAAANLQAQELVDLLCGAGGYGPVMEDTKTLIHADHGNLNSAPGVIQETTFTAGRLALRLSKDADGETLIQCSPRYLLVPAALETDAEKYLSSFYPAEPENINPFAGKLQLLVEPRLDAKSSTAWWMFADPGQAPCLEYSFLDSAQGPQINYELGFEYLGQSFRCVLDYGVGAIGYRGCWKGNN